MANYLQTELRGRTKEQQAVIQYFLEDGGCFSSIMDDAQYDEMVAKKITAVNWKKRALKYLGVDEDQVKEVEPVHFENWSFDSLSAYAKMGKDGIWRSSAYQITWIFFSDEQIYVYQRTINMVEDGKSERGEEYFYKDITNFSTVSETVEKEVLDKRTCRGEGIYSRQLVEADKFKIVVPGEKFECSVKKNKYTQTSIQGMKAKLREKKN